jgi:hypothetical protein
MSETYPPIQPLSPERAEHLAADPARQRLLDQIMSAMTREQIEAGWQAHRAWMAANPDDFGVLEAGEDLAYAEEGLVSRTDDAASTPGPLTLSRARGIPGI